MKRFLSIALALAFVFSGAQLCDAAIELNFDQLVDGGSLSYDGAGGALVGTDIRFDRITGFSTPLNNGASLDITGGVLNFMTGGNISEGPAVWTFGSGGSFVLTGTVTDPNNGNALVASGTLLTGSFSSSPANPIVVGGGPFLNVTAFGFDTKNQDLLDFYGITIDNFVFSNTEISSSNVVVGGDGSFSGDVTEADLVNQTIPEPATIIVWAALSVLSIAGISRARRS